MKILQQKLKTLLGSLDLGAFFIMRVHKNCDTDYRPQLDGDKGILGLAKILEFAFAARSSAKPAARVKILFMAGTRLLSTHRSKLSGLAPVQLLVGVVSKPPS